MYVCSWQHRLKLCMATKYKGASLVRCTLCNA
ncbi:unnamed protein product [Chondrus crispus]|uniref:Uncharacterized protein n=1 Tax=Chondrus crispus TaxID=2769 RepID=R7Q9S8_CHOCR|nr:unnamed protein product [Chondrus crispus]CDF34146.1 unnamed protein product [Chondrus crispus]|eukprot:XP_005713965.1 unnamed protein product [Chondrus crispus]